MSSVKLRTNLVRYFMQVQRARGAGVGHTRPSIWKKEEKKEGEEGPLYRYFLFLKCSRRVVVVVVAILQ